MNSCVAYHEGDGHGDKVPVYKVNTMEHLLTNKAQIFTGPTETDDKEYGPADAALEAADVVEEAEALDDHGCAATWVIR